MNFEKIKIKYNFNKAHKTYDQYCVVQNKVCDVLTHLTTQHRKNFNTIADFACGTGESTKRVIRDCQFQQCIGIDFSENLINIAKNKITDAQFILSDYDEVIFEKNSMDLIFCNMGFQWSLDFTKTISLMRDYLSPNGMLAFSIPLDGNFPEIRVVNKIVTPTSESVLNILRSLNMNVIHHSDGDYVETFPNQIAALRSITNVGARLVKSNNMKVGLSRAHVNNIFLDPENTSLTYKIGFFVAV